MYVCMHYVCMYVGMYVCMYVYICICIYVYMYICILGFSVVLEIERLNDGLNENFVERLKMGLNV